MGTSKDGWAPRRSQQQLGQHCHAEQLCYWQALQ
jgi:hypothetical protein